MSKALLVAALSLIIPASMFAADNLQLNRRLDYSTRFMTHRTQRRTQSYTGRNSAATNGCAGPAGNRPAKEEAGT